MNQSDHADAIRGLQIVYAAILLGALMFGVIVLVLRLEGLLDLGDGADLEIVTWMAAGVGVIMIPVGFVVRSVMRGKAASAEDEGMRMELFRGSTIVFAAMLEGGILFNIVALLLVGNFALNGGVALLGWAVAAALFPTREQFESMRI